jgi:5-formyltetrahydrofolate cyclo-ligase
MASLRDRGTRLALPVIVERGQPLVFREWQPGSLMTQGVWNVPMPESGQAVMPDLLVVPFVGFDAKGYRLGYGGGFYDRTIAAMPTKPRTIGVGFNLGRLETIYPQPHDIALERIITER